MSYMKDYSWIRDELMLLQMVLTRPTSSDGELEQRIGEYMGTHRAATYILHSILDGLADVIEEEEAKEDF